MECQPIPGFLSRCGADGVCAVRRSWHNAVLLTVLTGLAFPPANAAEEQTATEVRTLIQQGSFARALEELSGGQSGSAKELRLFQRAYCLQRLERWSPAAALYKDLISSGETTEAHDSQASAAPVETQESVAIDSVLQDYLLLFAATCLFQTEDFSTAEEYLRSLLGRSESLLLTEAEELLGELFLRRGRHREAIRIYRRLSAESSGRSEQARFQYRLAEAYRQAGEAIQSAALLKEIITDHPSSGEALQALEDYRDLGNEALAGEMLHRAGWVYYYNRRYDLAAGVWEQFVEAHRGSELAARALFLSARAHFRADRYESARERCRRLLSEYPRSDRLTSSVFLRARCDEEQGLTGKAIEGYRRFVETYPWSQLADDALWRLAGIAERDGRLADAEREYWNLSQRYASREDALLALWRAGLYALYRGDTGTARSRLQLLLSRGSGGEYTPGALYWIARAHAADGDRHLAERRMEEVIQVSGEGYYSDLAACWLGRVPQPETVGGEQLANVLLDMMGASSADLPDSLRFRLQKGRELIRLGLLSRARQELRAIHRYAHDYPAAVEELLDLYDTCQLPGDALRLVVSLRSRWPETRRRRVLQPYLYPRGYARLVAAEAETSGLDPYLVLALMRTESLFDPLAQSPAGAQGLMQIMPATGREIADRLGRSGEDETNPFDPRWSIRMGVTYLGQQLRAYRGQIQFALAAYNAGPGNTNRWLKRWEGVDPDLFVELIDFRETRRFIKKVLAARNRYRKVWGHAG